MVSMALRRENDPDATDLEDSSDSEGEGPARGGGAGRGRFAVRCDGGSVAAAAAATVAVEREMMMKLPDAPALDVHMEVRGQTRRPLTVFSFCTHALLPPPCP